MYVPVAGLMPISDFYGEPLAKGGNPIMPDDLIAGPATRDIRICARFGCWPALGWGLPPPQTTRLFLLRAPSLQTSAQLPPPNSFVQEVGRGGLLCFVRGLLAWNGSCSNFAITGPKLAV